MDEREALQRAKEMLGALTPLRSNCGLLCGAACCATDEDEQGGVYLFPGEQPERMPWGDVCETEFGPMLMCRGACEREERPFACRIFPLTPFRNAEGRLGVRMDARAKGVCPLVRSGKAGLDPDFVKAVRRALRSLEADEAQLAFLERWMAEETRFREAVDSLLG